MSATWCREESASPCLGRRLHAFDGGRDGRPVKVIVESPLFLCGCGSEGASRPSGEVMLLTDDGRGPPEEGSVH
jgi:hypothetical protein